MPINLQAFLSLSHTHTHTQNPLPLSTTSTISCCLKAIAQRWLSISVWNIRVPCHSCFSPQSLNIQTVWEGKHPVLRELTITLTIRCEELTHWKRPWCWERLKAEGGGDDRGWDGWVASLTRWTWVWAGSGRMLKDREAWHAAVHGVTKNRIWLSNWNELTDSFQRQKKSRRKRHGLNWCKKKKH